MKHDETSQVWRVVWRRMAEWETDDGQGSARPVFVAAWAAATRTVAEPPTPREFEDAWQAWLEAGAPLTATRKAEIIDAVCTQYPDRAEKIRRILSGIGPAVPTKD